MSDRYHVCVPGMHVWGAKCPPPLILPPLPRTIVSTTYHLTHQCPPYVLQVICTHINIECSGLVFAFGGQNPHPCLFCMSWPPLFYFQHIQYPIDNLHLPR